MAQTATPGPGKILPDPPFKLAEPSRQTTPILVASPHSGRSYPSEFVAASRLAFHALRRSEDSFVDELFESATRNGIPLLRADFPRAYCDVNREAWELDPLMFVDKLPSWCNTSSTRVLAGFGTIARLVSSGEPIYRTKLKFADAEHRILTCWRPYHKLLNQLIDNTLLTHGTCLLLDAHSMPSLTSCSPAKERSSVEPDFVLGDAFGTSCGQPITQFTEHFLRQRGFQVRRNDPYAGGYVTRHYGRPLHQVHVLQIEIARSLYMNEVRYEKLDRFAEICTILEALLASLAENLSTLIPSR